VRAEFGLLAGLLALAGSPGFASEPVPPRPEARVAFATHGGIRDWRPDGRDAILIESRASRYYRATFFTPCPDPPFANAVGFVTDSRDVLDRFQSIELGHQRCPFSRLEEIPKPAKG
jgi:hypothetical protein